MRRLAIAAAACLAFLIAVWLVVVTVGKGYVDDQASTRLARELDGPAKVRIGNGYSPGLLLGHLGNVRITAGPLDRDGVRLEAIAATIHGASVSPSEALSASPTMRFSGIDGTARIAPAELGRLLRRALAARGIPGAASARVRGTGSSARIVVGGVSRPLDVDVEDGSTVRAVANLGAFALSVAIKTGDLPYGLALTSARIVGGGASLGVARPAGSADLGGG
jgi:LmeA-like phospholipid-binding